MINSLLSSTPIPLKFRQIPTSINHLNTSLPNNLCPNFKSLNRFQGIQVLSGGASNSRLPCTKAVLSELPNQKVYPKIGAQTTGPVSSYHLLEVVESAARTGAQAGALQVVMDAVNKPRNITYKGLTDLVTDTDKKSEVAILEVVRENFSDHLILGEEGGLIGDASSEYLWCIDPLDGTTNFAHSYPSFAVSVGVLFRGRPAAAAV
ncbi:Inositol monophosphatase-like, partial [Dillenia turbinata]